ncbi:MAG TPA: alpha/beta fold hydrolase [Acidobacteriaceae bacterium]
MLVLWVGAIYALGCVVSGITLAEISLHLPKRLLGSGSAYRSGVSREFGAQVQDVSIAASDGAVLRAWFVVPPKPNNKAVVALHGITDNRLGAAGFGDYFLAHGYSVLLPDSREHGTSGGAVATYGILERDDVRRWVAWLREQSPGCTYLLGESMGAAIGLQAAAVTPQLCAVAVESPYSTFREISYERLGRETGLGTLFWRTVGRPVVEVAILYAGARYDVNLPNAEPKAAVASSRVPTLLIAGTADKNIPPHHAQELEAACPSHCVLWIVAGAGHGGASSVAPVEFWKRVGGWFESHGGSAP